MDWFLLSLYWFRESRCRRWRRESYCPGAEGAVKAPAAVCRKSQNVV